MRLVLNVFLSAALLLVLSLNWILRPDPAVRNVEVMAEMVNSVAFESQSEYTALAGGNTSLAPVPGTVARGFLPIRYGSTPEEAKRAGEDMVNPRASDDRRSLARGTEVFGNVCVPCHGPTGLGDGPVTKRGFPPPPSLFAETGMAMKDGQMFHIITYGQKNMPPHATQVSREDRWDVILHVRDLQRKFVAEQAAAAARAAAPRAPAAATAAKDEAGNPAQAAPGTTVAEVGAQPVAAPPPVPMPAQEVH